MKICTIVLNKIDLHAIQEASNGEPVTLTTLPAGATFIRMDDIKGDIHIIYSMEDEEPQSELEAAIEKAGKTKYTLYEVQEDGTSKPIRTLESSERLEPLKRLNIMSDQSRKLNQELLRQYQEKVTELKELLK